MLEIISSYAIYHKFSFIVVISFLSFLFSGELLLNVAFFVHVHGKRHGQCQC